MPEIEGYYKIYTEKVQFVESSQGHGVAEKRRDFVGGVEDRVDSPVSGP